MENELFLAVLAVALVFMVFYAFINIKYGFVVGMLMVYGLLNVVGCIERK